MSRERLRMLNDPALWPVIDAADEQSRDAAIEELLRNVAKPVIATILRRFRRVEPDLHVEDFEEVSSLVTLRLIRKVRAAAVREEHAIEVLEKYLATVTYNGLYDLRRHRYPERHRLKRNLRYLVTRDRAFALWDASASPVAGLAEWHGQPPLSRAEAFARVSETARMQDKSRPVEALRAIFESIGRPILFESLVDLAAGLWNVRDVVVESGEFPAAQQQDQLASLEQRQYLEALWCEIRELPYNQRTVLLLNLRDSGGSNALMLFVLLNVAGVADIAGLAGLSEDELTGLWGSLPMDDLTLADRLDLTRQQVINLRKAARMRLARRMAKWK